MNYQYILNKDQIINFNQIWNYDDYLCFWRCLAYHRTKPDEERNIKMEMRQIFKDYYGIKLDKNTFKNYNGVEYVAYDKEYNDEA